MATDPEKLMPRDEPDPTESRAALVKRLHAQIVEGKAHWKKDFDRMRRNMKFARGKQYADQREDDDRYQANLIQREIKTMVSALYAKNPTVVIKRRKTLDFQIWDGKPESLAMAQQTMMMATQAAAVTPDAPASPEMMAGIQSAGALLADVQQGAQRRQMIDKIGETLVCLADYYMNEGSPPFKLQMKQMVRRARTTGVGYVKLGFQRDMEMSEDQHQQIADMAERLATIGRLTADLGDGEVDPTSSEAEELRLATQAIQSQPEVIVREGVVYSFPASTRLIPSPCTETLMGWVGCDWLAEEIMLTPDRVKEVYGVDLGKDFTAYRVLEGQSTATGETRRVADRKKGLACVWHLYDKGTGLEYVICEGHKDFLKEPAPPAVFIEQFYPYFAWAPNVGESEGEVFPLSDVELLKHIQKEYNRSKEAIRQHRIANRPLYLAPNGAFEEDEEKALTEYAAHDVIKLNGLDKGQKAQDVLMPVAKIGIDPNLYETETLFADMQRVTGLQEANLGGTSNSTATEAGIAEQSRMGTLSLDGDDLDDMLGLLFRSTSQVMLTELDTQTVMTIAGPGAVWPELSRSDIAKELWLETQAGSSGRPNQARDAANLERVGPLLLQIPGISPRWLAERAVKIADDDTNLEDAYIDGMPSIMSLNKVAQLPTGDPATDPNAQGEEGGDKDRAPEPGGTAQPGFPGAGEGVGGSMQ